MQPSTTISKSQRVIKFRAWDGEKMHWLDHPWNDHWYNSQKGGKASLDNTNLKAGKLFASGQLILMQFTGLLDKNEKEIYEHDIKRETIEYDEWDEVLYFVCVWIKEWAMFAWLSPDEYHDYIECGVESLDMTMFCTYPAGADEPKMDITICGNIYQNTELLTQQ